MNVQSDARDEARLDTGPPAQCQVIMCEAIKYVREQWLAPIEARYVNVQCRRPGNVINCYALAIVA